MVEILINFTSAKALALKVSLLLVYKFATVIDTRPLRTIVAHESSPNVILLIAIPYFKNWKAKECVSNGNLAIYKRPTALRPYLAISLPFTFPSAIIYKKN